MIGRVQGPWSSRAILGEASASTIGAHMAVHSLSIANFNVHAGVNGYGEPYDVVSSCISLDVDILVLEEVFAPDDAASIADEVAAKAGYRVVEADFGRLSVFPRPRGADQRRWGPSQLRRFARQVLHASHDPRSDRRAERRRGERRGGRISLALLSRIPLESAELLALPRLGRDRVSRRAIVAVTEGSEPIRIIAAHLGHLTHGSIRQMRVLRRVVQQSPLPTLLIGDMNCWGPPLALYFSGHRAIRGASWPSWRPHSQLDHVLTFKGVRVLSGAVLADAGSDHRPVRAEVAWGAEFERDLGRSKSTPRGNASALYARRRSTRSNANRSVIPET